MPFKMVTEWHELCSMFSRKGERPSKCPRKMKIKFQAQFYFIKIQFYGIFVHEKIVHKDMEKSY